MSTNQSRRSNYNSRNSISGASIALDEFAIENYKRKIKEQESDISNLQKELHNYRMKEGDFLFSATMMKFSTEKKRKRDEYDDSSCNDTSQSVAKSEQKTTDSSHPVANGKPQISVEEHENKLAEKSAQVQNLEQENSDLKIRITSLKESFKRLEQEFKEFKEKSQNHSDNILSENNRIKELHEQAVKKTENEIESLKNELVEKENSLNQAKQELETRKKDFENAKSESDNQIKSITAQLEQLQNQQPVPQIVNNEEREKELTQQIKTSEDLNTKLQEEIETFKKEKTLLEQQVICLNSDLINSQQQEKERTKKVSELESVMSLLDDDKKRLEILLKENETLSEERVRSALSESESKDVRMAELEKDKQELASSVTELKSKIENFTNQSDNLQQYITEIDSQKQMISQKLQEIEEQNTTIIEYENVIKKLQQDLSSESDYSSKNINELESKLKTLNSELSSVSESHANLLNEKMTLQHQILELENVKVELTNQIQTLQNTNQTLQNSISEHENQKQIFQTSLSEFETKYSESVNNVNLLQSQIEDFKQLQQQIETLKSENDQLQKELGSSTQLLSLRVNEVSALQQEKEQLLQQKDEEVKQKTTKYEAYIHERDVKVKNLESEMQELKKTLESTLSAKNHLDLLTEQQQKTFETKINEITEQANKNQEKHAAALSEAHNEKNLMSEKFKNQKSELVDELKQWKAKSELLQSTVERYRLEAEEESKNKKKGIKRDSQDDSLPLTMDPPKKKVKNDTAKKELKVIFSGFNDKMERYTNAFKKNLEDCVKELGGSIVEDVDKGATHVVAPPGVRTIKVLQAAVAHIWIMSPEWLVECKNQSKIVDELSFGKLRDEELFKGKNISFTDNFSKECEHQKYKAQKRMSNAKTLVEGGEGSITNDMNVADFILVSAEENVSSTGKTKRMITWEGFLDYIFPKHN